jgi:hypothetical protein
MASSRLFQGRIVALTMLVPDRIAPTEYRRAACAAW